MLSTYKFLLEVVRVYESILGGEEDVLNEFLIAERSDIVIGVNSVVPDHALVDATRIHPFRLGMLPTSSCN